jgi:hypothetical protein
MIDLRHDQSALEEGGCLVFADSALRQPRQRLGHGRARLGRDALPVLGEVGEQGEEHEAAHEGERVVEAQRIEPGVDRVRRHHAAMPVDRGGPDIFDPPEQGLAVIVADDVAEQLAEKAYVRVLLDCRLRHRRRNVTAAPE